MNLADKTRAELDDMVLSSLLAIQTTLAERGIPGSATRGLLTLDFNGERLELTIGPAKPRCLLTECREWERAMAAPLLTPLIESVVKNSSRQQSAVGEARDALDLLRRMGAP